MQASVAFKVSYNAGVVIHWAGCGDATPFLTAKSPQTCRRDRHISRDICNVNKCNDRDKNNDDVNCNDSYIFRGTFYMPGPQAECSSALISFDLHTTLRKEY